MYLSCYRRFLKVSLAPFIGALALQPTTAVAQEFDTADAAASTNAGSAIAVGVDGSKGGYAVYGAGTLALNGDLYAEGVLVRASAGTGEYRAGQTPFATNGNVTFYSGSVLVGYQHRLSGGGSITGFVGPEVIHNGDGADPRVRGTEVAARVIGEFYIPSDSVDFSTWATYSTFENQYFVNGRAILHSKPAHGGIGPDISLFGGDGWQRVRAGLHVSMPVSFGEVGVGAGYDWDIKGNANESPYASVSFSFPM